jgi:hypothetical protein
MSSATADPADLHEAAERQAHGNPWSRLLAVSRGSWALLLAVVALASSGTTALFALLPQLKPDPRDSVLAQLNAYAIEPDVSLKSYLQLAYGNVVQEAKSLQIPREELSFKGDMVYVRTRVDGFKHRRVRLMATVYLKATQRPASVVPGPVSGPSALRLRSVALDTPSTSTVQLFWILSLNHEPPTFVRVEMFDHTRMLAVADSPVIRNGTAPLPGA